MHEPKEYKIFYKFIDIYIELEELLSDKILDKFVVIYELFVINFCSAF